MLPDITLRFYLLNQIILLMSHFLLLNGKSNTGFNQIFDKYSERSDFKKCRKVISEKQKELGAYGGYE